MLEPEKLKILLEAILLAADRPLTEEQILALFLEEEKPSLGVLRQALRDLETDLVSRGVELVQVATGYRFQVRQEWAPWVSRLWEEKAPRYSRALLETLALIAYRQPITRGEIEDIRGVSVSSSIIKTLHEDREWIRVVGHREVPGRPALYATTKNFLDYFGLKNLQDLPALPEVLNIDRDESALEMPILSSEEENISCHISAPSLSPLEESLELEDAADVLDENGDEEKIEESLSDDERSLTEIIKEVLDVEA